MQGTQRLNLILGLGPHMLAVEPGLLAVTRLLVARLKQHYSFVPLHQAIIIDLVMQVGGDLVVVGLS